MHRSRFQPASETGHRYELYDIIFGYTSRWGRFFDIALLIVILASVACICLETVDWIHEEWGWLLIKLEWAFTILFTLEYATRLYVVKRPLRYATSFFGIVDLLAFLPTYVSLLPFADRSFSFAVARALRLLRVFRILNLSWFMREADDMGRAVMKARAKIVVFLGVVLICVTIAGTLMYEVENRDRHIVQQELRAEDQIRNVQIESLRTQLDELGLQPDDLVDASDSKFTSIPESMYWAIVTMTTVGYGDIVPTTTAGKFVAAVLILLGYSLIIVPTGFVAAEFIDDKYGVAKRECGICHADIRIENGVFCPFCGNPIEQGKSWTD